jgi:hypothetical protein
MTKKSETAGTLTIHYDRSKMKLPTTNLQDTFKNVKSPERAKEVTQRRPNIKSSVFVSNKGVTTVIVEDSKYKN